MQRMEKAVMRSGNDSNAKQERSRTVSLFIDEGAMSRWLRR
jgi:hypothetical protein